MVRSCARPVCNAPAAATFTFDGLRRIVWISPLAEAAAYSAGDLCARHANALTPPRNWELRDSRAVATGPPPEKSGAEAPSRYLAPTAPTPTEPVERVPAPAARARRRPAKVPAIPRAGVAPELEATTPLLERAFRAANVG